MQAFDHIIWCFQKFSLDAQGDWSHVSQKGQSPLCAEGTVPFVSILGEDSDDIYGYDVDGNKVVNVADIVELIKIIRKTAK